MLLAFSHIPKTAGTTLSHLLQRHFGPRHVSVHHRRSASTYRLRDLELDLRLHPFARSLSGHALKPFVDFGSYDERLQWYTLVRDPVKRFISLYQHQMNAGRREHQMAFDAWIKKLDRRNWMVRWIAGEEDIEAAKQILMSKFRFVGMVEEFDASLLILRDRFQLPDFVVDYAVPDNTAPSTGAKEHIRRQMERYEDAILENNALDMDLYRFVADEIWRRQVAEYGKERLDRDLKAAFPRHADSSIGLARRMSYIAYRNVVYKPFLWLDRAVQPA